MSVQPIHELKLLGRQNIELGTVVYTGCDEYWNRGMFHPSDCFDLVEALFRSRDTVIDEQCFLHEDLLYGAILGLGLTLNGRKLIDFQLHRNNECGWKYSTEKELVSVGEEFESTRALELNN